MLQILRPGLPRDLDLLGGKVSMGSPAKCHNCHAQVLEPEGEQVLPSVVNPAGNGVTVRVLAYKCDCGRRFSVITYQAPFSPLFPPAKYALSSAGDPRD